MKHTRYLALLLAALLVMTPLFALAEERLNDGHVLSV